MANTASELTSSVNGLSSEVKGRVQTVEKRLEKATREAGEQLGSMVSQVAHSTEDAYLSGRKYVEDNPVRSTVIAAAAGVVLGGFLTMLLRGRN